jgi:putative hemolysin
MNRSTAAGEGRVWSRDTLGRRGAVRQLADLASGMHRLRALHAAVGEQPDVRAWVRRCLEVLGCGFDAAPSDLERIPAEGGLLVVANRPFGTLEGLLALHLLGTVRDDVRVLTGDDAPRVDALEAAQIHVGARGRGVRDAARWLREGHCLIAFPAAGIAQRAKGEKATSDPAWGPLAARLARRAACPVLPVYFEGGNRRLVQLADRLHPRLGTALLPRTLLDQVGRTIHARVGKPILPAALARFGEPTEAAAYLRLRTHVLGRSLPQDASKTQRLVRLLRPRTSLGTALAPAIDPDLLAADIAALDPSARLADGGDLEAWLAPAERLPHVLPEIGRLREETFRAVGEGTGQATDLDRFDRDYLHLFLWEPKTRRIAGAYRLGPTDRLLARGGLRALYTSTLFDMDRKFVEHVTPGLELGRSFVRPEFQRSFMPLLLLWRGIGEFVARNPQYHRLFGPVSISASYSPASRDLIVEHLREHEFLPEFANLVRAKRPHRAETAPRYGLRWTPSMLRDLGEVSAMVADMERDAKGVPVLIREYLKLGGKILGFNVDPDFANVVDGLVLVDLAETERRLLVRYMGAEGADRFLEAQERAMRGGVVLQGV